MNEAETILVQELRSGKYTQARDRLIVHQFGGGEAYCCLGVACLVLGTGEFGSDGYYTVDGSSHDLFLPISVRDRLEWKTYRGELSFLDRGGDKISLDHLNDTGFSFAQIADLIAADLVEHAWKDDEIKDTL